MTRRLFVLSHRQARERAAAAILEAPEGDWVTIDAPKKRRVQEERYHAMMGDIAKQCTYHGRKLALKQWKRLLVEAMVHILREEAKAQGKRDPFPDSGQLLPSIDGLRFVQVDVLTRDFTIPQASAFIEYLFAFGAERGVEWSDESRSKREEVAA